MTRFVSNLIERHLNPSWMSPFSESCIGEADKISLRQIDIFLVFLWPGRSSCFQFPLTWVNQISRPLVRFYMHNFWEVFYYWQKQFCKTGRNLKSLCWLTAPLTFFVSPIFTRLDSAAMLSILTCTEFPIFCDFGNLIIVNLSTFNSSKFMWNFLSTCDKRRPIHCTCHDAPNLRSKHPCN